MKTNLKENDLVTIADGSYAVRVDSYEKYTRIGLCKDEFKVISLNGSPSIQAYLTESVHDIFIENTVTGRIYLHTAQFVRKVEKATIDWSKFDYNFFNQYGGLMIAYKNSLTPTTRANNCLPKESSATLRESPFYCWPGGECPVPGDVEVEVAHRNGVTMTVLACGRYWSHDGGTAKGDIIRFRLTGKVL